MQFGFRHILVACTAAALVGAAEAGDFSNAATYNSPYGMAAGQENQAVNPSLRDGNGNLTVVNGQFTSSAFSQQTGVQSMGTMSGTSLASLGNTTGTSGSLGAYGGATAVGNSLNVVTVGNNNTVVVNSTQINNGTQNASVTLNGSSAQ